MKSNRNSAVLETPESKLLFIKKTEIPEGTKRGRVSFLSNMPFWSELVYILAKGLSPSEAIEVDIAPTMTPDGQKIPTSKLVSAIRHQFQKIGLSERYSLILRDENRRLFITDHDTAAAA